MDKNGIPIGKVGDKPILYTCTYEIEKSDGHKDSLAAS